MMLTASVHPVAARAAALADRRHREAPCKPQARSAAAFLRSEAPARSVDVRSRPSRRHGLTPPRAEGGGSPAQTAAALLQTAQTVPEQVSWHQATVVENRWAGAGDM